MAEKEPCFWCGKESAATLTFAGVKRRACTDCGKKWTLEFGKAGSDIGISVGGELVSYLPSKQLISEVKEKAKAGRLMCAYCSRRITEALVGFHAYIPHNMKGRHIYVLCPSCEAKCEAKIATGDKEILESIEDKIESGLYQLGEESRGYELYGEPIARERKGKVEPGQKIPVDALRQAGFFTEALEKQCELIDVWRGQDGERWASRIRPALMQAQGAAPSVKDIQRLAVHELENGEPYFVAKNICELIEMTATTIPDVPLLSDMLPTTNGWVYLEKSFPLGPPSQIEVSPFGNPPKLKAFSWGLEYTKKADQVTDGIGATFYEDGIPVPYPIEFCNWAFGVNWGSDWENVPLPYATKIEDEVARKRSEAIRQYVLTLFSFLNQRLLVISHQRPTRDTRRRYEKRWTQEAPLIKVILLRVKKYTTRGETREVEWSCRWIVRGHWRAQWYRSIVSHKAIWITPHIKGPEGKPLKKPAANLFAVVR